MLDKPLDRDFSIISEADFQNSDLVYLQDNLFNILRVGYILRYDCWTGFDGFSAESQAHDSAVPLPVGYVGVDDGFNKTPTNRYIRVTESKIVVLCLNER